jgi:hypothetical protein
MSSGRRFSSLMVVMIVLRSGAGLIAARGGLPSWSAGRRVVGGPGRWPLERGVGLVGDDDARGRRTIAGLNGGTKAGPSRAPRLPASSGPTAAVRVLGQPLQKAGVARACFRDRPATNVKRPAIVADGGAFRFGLPVGSDDHDLSSRSTSRTRGDAGEGGFRRSPSNACARSRSR